MVKVAGGGIEPVARAGGDQQVCWPALAEQLTEPADVGLNHRRRGGRGIVTPECVDQRCAPQAGPGVQRQQAQHRPLLGRANRNRLTAAPRLHRPEHTEPQQAGLARGLSRSVRSPGAGKRRDLVLV